MRLGITLFFYILAPLGIFGTLQYFALKKGKGRLVKLLPAACALTGLAVSLACGIYVFAFADFLSLAMLDIMVIAGVCALALAGCLAGRGVFLIVDLAKKQKLNSNLLER